MTHMSESVGIRQLQQNASKVVARARAGEVIQITDHGRPVAQLGPVPRSRVQELIDAGLATPATRSIRDLPPPLPALDEPLTEELTRMRADER